MREWNVEDFKHNTEVSAPGKNMRNIANTGMYEDRPFFGGYDPRTNSRNRK